MTSRPPSSYRTLASFSRIQLLHFLQQRGTMTVGDLAEATGLHHNTTREHLQRLISDGFVTCEPEITETKGRPRMLYSAAGGADHQAGCIREAKAAAAERRGDLVRRMLPLQAILHSPLQRQLDALDDHLDQTGFDATLDPDGDHVHLHDCPYSEMVKAHPEVCRVHFGLIKGLLEQAEGPLAAEALHPLVEANLCTLDLHRAEPGPAAEPERESEREPEREPANIYHGVFGL
ncbi:winged helix-turn-helix transcriptional regulator [Cryobacterium algoritolerans]|uniref:Winged helix-turn-helix transcriptional regulator n=1 Tax=Cryobacterium algoritolerans TaxID=1259184 RepID=A0A4R8WLB2_9MICO|nr:helix-turn-helix domain-containing protein [Cryobacterium algoritolerans]TFC08966.1 winged helix-turn-helix transcriptional regulator [Cryobacterium algoritolerans]